jgi:hypothetical protein
MPIERKLLPERTPLVVAFGCVAGGRSTPIATAFAHLVEANKLPIRVIADGIHFGLPGVDPLPDLRRAHVIFAVTSQVDRSDLPANVVSANTLHEWKISANLPEPDHEFETLKDAILAHQPQNVPISRKIQDFDFYYARFALLYLQHHGYIPKPET